MHIYLILQSCLWSQITGHATEKITRCHFGKYYFLKHACVIMSLDKGTFGINNPQTGFHPFPGTFQKESHALCLYHKSFEKQQPSSSSQYYFNMLYFAFAKCRETFGFLEVFSPAPPGLKINQAISHLTNWNSRAHEAL